MIILNCHITAGLVLTPTYKQYQESQNGLL